MRSWLSDIRLVGRRVGHGNLGNLGRDRCRTFLRPPIFRSTIRLIPNILDNGWSPLGKPFHEGVHLRPQPLYRLLLSHPASYSLRGDRMSVYRPQLVFGSFVLSWEGSLR